MTEAYLSKFDCLQRAKRLYVSNHLADLRYACLELRMCLEAITYEKLTTYAQRLPPDVLSKWQPPQAVAALLNLEDDAGQEYVLAIGRTRETLEYFGEHRTFALPWLRKHYNKVGSFLHVPNPNVPDAISEVDQIEELKEYLNEIIRECDRVCESSLLGGGMTRTVKFTCQACGRNSIANATSAERIGRVKCIHPSCQAEHAVTGKDDKHLFFRLTGAIFPCQSCKQEIFVASNQLVPEHEFACSACGRRHKLIDQVWRYSAEIVGEER